MINNKEKRSEMEENFKWLDRYLKTHYTGFIKGNYDIGCHLYFKDLNNFIQNVGRYHDVIIVRNEDNDILLNTCGNYVDRIWPSIPWGARTNETMQRANYIAEKLCELREEEGYFPEALPKVTKFMNLVLGPEIVAQNDEFLKGVKQEERESIQMK